MQKDVRRTIHVDAVENLAKYDRSNGDILVTGGTGFFGPFLLKSLLEQNREKIYVLVRSDNPEHGMTRLRKAFALVKATRKIEEHFNQRVIPICGDISLEKFGLCDEQWRFLAHHTHTIYHNGAQVNYLLDYGSCLLYTSPSPRD